jgi:hypothetical protein
MADEKLERKAFRVTIIGGGLAVSSLSICSLGSLEKGDH